MAKLSKTEKYAIQWLAYQGFDVASISKELKISETSINNILEKNQHINADNKVPSGSEPVGKNNKSKTLMINETAVKKTKSVSVMTEAASQQGDEARKKISVRNNNKNIYRPHNA